MSVPTGVLLVQRGVATQALVDEAWRMAKQSGERLCSQLLAMGLPEGPLVAALSEKHGVPGVDLSRCVVDLGLLDLVPRLVAEHDHIMPLSGEGGRLHLAMSEPSDERVLSELRFVTGREVSPYVVIRRAVHAAIRQAYDAHERGHKVWRGAAAGAGLPPQLATVRPDGDEPVDIADGDLVPLELEEDFIEVTADEPLVAAAGEVVISVRASGRKTVLVVDDEPEIRTLVQRALEKHGYAVETAADGAEAVEKAEALVPDLVLLDAMLPKLHGFEACRRIKSSPRTRQVPVIMMTAIYRGWRFAQDARDAYGAEDYVEKPFRFEDLLRRMEAVLESTASRPKAEEGATPFVARGKELLAANKLAEAQAQFEAALQVDPYSAEAHAQLAKTLRARGEAYGAMTAFERAVELKPGWLAVLRALAALYEEKGFRRKATGALERALAAAGDDTTRAAIRQDLMALLG